MNFAFAVFILVLVSLTAVSSQFAANWTLDWQSTYSLCAPSSFLIIGDNSTGYIISYTYPYNVSCYNSFNSTLTPTDTSGNSFNDSKGQSIAYYGNNNTILFVVNSTLNNPILFSQNGAYIPKEVVRKSLVGVWANLEYDFSACAIQPPTNISITILETFGEPNIYTPSASYYNSSSSYMKPITSNLQLFVPQINQLMWQMAYADALGYANISYTINPTTNQSTLQFIVPQSSGASCVGSYIRSLSLFLGTWYPSGQNPGGACAPSSFLITWNTSINGYSISYNYSTCRTSYNSSLTPAGSFIGSYVDDLGQTLNYFDNQISLACNSTSPFPFPFKLTVQFSQNGTYPRQEVAGLVAGVWTNPVFNSSACQTAPPLNISIGVPGGSVNYPNATYYTSTDDSTSSILTLFVPQIDQPMWTMYYSQSGGNATISYIVDPTTNQSTLQFQVPQSSGSSCIGTYTRDPGLFSGTWYPDWQDGDVSYYTFSNDLPTSIQVINIFNIYMSVTYNYDSNPSQNGIIYLSPFGYTDTVFGYSYSYDPVSSTFMATYKTKFLYSQNRSALSAQPFLGNWTNSVPISHVSDFSDYCCQPQNVTITNYTSTSSYTLSALLQFDSNTLETTSGCEAIDSLIQDSSIQMFINIRHPNGANLTYQNHSTIETDGYYLYVLSLNNSQLQISYGFFSGYGYGYGFGSSSLDCTFALTQTVPPSPPSPLFAHWISKGISVFVFAWIVIFI